MKQFEAILARRIADEKLCAKRRRMGDAATSFLDLQLPEDYDYRFGGEHIELILYPRGVASIRDNTHESEGGCWGGYANGPTPTAERARIWVDTGAGTRREFIRTKGGLLESLPNGRLRFFKRWPAD